MTAAEHPALDAGARVVRTVAAVIRDAGGRVLLVRKRGRSAFIQPGGKRDAGEDDLAALARELREEIGCELVPGSASCLGTFSAPAANEPGWRVEAVAYRVEVRGEPSPRAEIEELRWLPLPPSDDVEIAPLSRERILPSLL